LAFLVGVLPSDAFDLDDVGSIEGRVIDRQSGLPLAGATIRLLGTDTHTLSDEDGYFTIPPVQSGTYTVEATRPGYERVVMRGIRVSSGQTLPLDIAMKEDSDAIYTLDEIVVTATRVKERTIDIAGSVSVINRDVIERMPTANLVDIIGIFPGFQTYSANGNAMTPGVNIRGFTGGGLAEYLLVLVDGVPVNDLENGLVNWNLVPAQNIERIEILRGPSSALYGDMALGGVMNIITDTPKATPSTTVSLEGGSFGDYAGRLNLTHLSGPATYDISASEQRRDGWRDHSRWRGETVNGKMATQVGKEWRVSLTSINQWTDSQTPGPLTRSQLQESREQSTLALDREEQRRHLAFLNVGREEAGKWRMESSLHFKYKDNDVIQTLFFETKEQLKDVYALGVSGQYSRTASWKAIDHYLVIGSGLEWGNIRSRYYDLDAGGTRADEPSTDGSGKREKIACYIQDRIVPVEPVSVTFGLRWDWIRDTYDDELNPTEHPSSSTSALSTKISTNWQFDRSGHIYATFGQAFKAPTMEQLFDQRPFSSPYEDGFFHLSNPELNPQTGTNYEIGLYRQFGPLLEMALSAYRMNMKDEIEFDVRILKYANIGQSQHRGFEGEVRFYPVSSINGFFSYAYSDARYESGENKGHQINNIPYHVLTLGALLKSDFGLRGGAVVSSVKDQYTDGANEHPLPDYTTLNVRLSYEKNPVILSVDVNNVFDRKYSSFGYIDPLTNAEMLFPSVGRHIRGSVTVVL